MDAGLTVAAMSLLALGFNWLLSGVAPEPYRIERPVPARGGRGPVVSRQPEPVAAPPAPLASAPAGEISPALTTRTSSDAAPWVALPSSATGPAGERPALVFATVGRQPASGRVTLLLEIAENGQVDEVTATDVAGVDPSLVAVVQETARSWRYPAVLRNKQPVRSERRVVVELGPEGSPSQAPTIP